MDYVKITRTLLDKDRSQLTEDELKAVDEHNERTKRRYDTLAADNARIRDDCRMLCSGCERHPIPEPGWTVPVRELCYALEALNYRYARYGLRVILEQSKEKYATLRFYTHIQVRPTGFIGLLYKMADGVAELLSKVDYGLEYVVTKPEWKSVEWNEITKEQFEGRTNRFGHAFPSFMKTVVLNEGEGVPDLTSCDDTVYFRKGGDGKYYHSYTVHHMAERKAVFRKHPVLRRLRLAFLWLSGWVWTFERDTVEKKVMRKAFDDEVDRLVGRAEDECEKLCQECGIPFGVGDVRKCETSGWFTYLCQDCADARGGKYIDVETGEKFVEGVKVENGKEGESGK